MGESYLSATPEKLYFSPTGNPSNVETYDVVSIERVGRIGEAPSLEISARMANHQDNLLAGLQALKTVTGCGLQFSCNIPCDQKTKNDTVYQKMYRFDDRHSMTVPEDFVKKVIFNAPATIVFWYDGTKTVVKCGPNDVYDPEKGFAIAFMKRFFGNNLEFHKCLKTVRADIDKWWDSGDCNGACTINFD